MSHFSCTHYTFHFPVAFHLNNNERMNLHLSCDTKFIAANYAQWNDSFMLSYYVVMESTDDVTQTVYGKKILSSRIVIGLITAVIVI